MGQSKLSKQNIDSCSENLTQSDALNNQLNPEHSKACNETISMDLNIDFHWFINS